MDTKLYQEIYSESEFLSSFIDILCQHGSHIESTIYT